MILQKWVKIDVIQLHTSISPVSSSLVGRTAYFYIFCHVWLAVNMKILLETTGQFNLKLSKLIDSPIIAWSYLINILNMWLNTFDLYLETCGLKEIQVVILFENLKFEIFKFFMDFFFCRYEQTSQTVVWMGILEFWKERSGRNSGSCWKITRFTNLKLVR